MVGVGGGSQRLICFKPTTVMVFVCWGCGCCLVVTINRTSIIQISMRISQLNEEFCEPTRYQLHLSLLVGLCVSQVKVKKKSKTLEIDKNRLDHNFGAVIFVLN